jgi:rfaE bifunctional protein kinase chain/domain
LNVSPERLDAILGACRGKKIAVVGDLMLDRYFWGSVHRVSPEAPVPVVEVEEESTRLGGAANVANNIASLGGTPLMVGLVGNDYQAQLLVDMVKESGFDQRGIVTDASRPTTIKTRVIAQGQHVVRIDNESKAPCPEHLVARLVDAVRYNIHEIDGIILEDYNKGVITGELITELIAVARKYNKTITVDPKFDNFFAYKNVTVFKPNRREAESVLGGRLSTNDEVVAAGRKLIENLDAENVLITRSEQGMTLCERNGSVLHLPTAARNVQDVSGAGDTVISTLTIALAAGATVREACVLANHAGGIVVGTVGIVPVRPDELREEVLARSGS